ncbi:hypothetical protein ABMA28_006825 [Loxostege sticticalis]|uniref:Peptidase S1 domain-containing protein n=1 Tax=Loxostege sticticalis TaxID=481309 RepID=A0ABD0TNK2_LOXSC
MALEFIKVFIIFNLILTGSIIIYLNHNHVITAGESLSSRATQGTNIGTYPFMAALLRAPTGTNYQHSCAGTILNNRSVLTAARCVYEDAPSRWRFRLGSSRHNSGGNVYAVTVIYFYRNFDEWAMMSDIAIVRTNTNIRFGNNVRAGSFAGRYYIVGNNQPVSTVGWGYTSTTIALNTCRTHYSAQGFFIREESQICSGFSNPGSVSANNARDKCLGEPGAPLIHLGTIVGVRSYALSCNSPAVPTVSTRVGYFISWISTYA